MQKMCHAVKQGKIRRRETCRHGPIFRNLG